MLDCSTQIKGDIEGEDESLLENNKALVKKVFGVRLIKGNDVAIQFYYWFDIMGYVSSCFHVSFSIYTSKPSFNDFFSVFVRLRLNLFIMDLSSRLGVCNGTMFNIFQKWLDIMFVQLQFLITWPSREVVHNNMPLLFQQLYPRCRVIIDCSEIIIETPSSFDSCSKTYSNYIMHNTVKFLITIWYNFLFIPI